MVLVPQGNTRAAAKAQLRRLKCPDRKDFGSTYQQSFWVVRPSGPTPRYHSRRGRRLGSGEGRGLESPLLPCRDETRIGPVTESAGPSLVRRSCAGLAVSADSTRAVAGRP